MKFEIKKATKKAARLRMALIGLSGGGKTYKSLLIARELAGPEGRVIVIDTERGSASKYADVTNFDVIELETFAPRTYVDAIHACEEEGADVIVIDSLSHAWIGKDGALDQVDRFAKRQSGNSFGAWREVTPQHNELVDAILRARAHVVVTIRAKMDYSQEKDERTGRTIVRKVGLAAVQREGMEYEFDVVADVDFEHNAVISKTRCSALADKVFSMRDTETLARDLRGWLTDGATPAAPVAPRPTPRPAEAPAQAQRAREPGEDDDAPAPAPSPGAAQAALDAFYARVGDVEMPGEAVMVWLKHRAALAPLDDAARKEAWSSLVKCVARVGKMDGAKAKTWLKKAVDEETERLAPASSEADHAAA